MDTYASNPGQINAKFTRLLRHNPKWYVIWGGLFLVFQYWGHFSGNYWLYIGCALFAILFFLTFKRQQIHFSRGDVNIAKIISRSPDVYAAYTNMLTGLDDKDYPVVKIVQRKIPVVEGMSFEVGDYISAACMYSGPMDKAHWLDFFPIPMSVGTSDLDALRFHRKNLESSQAELELRLTMVPQPLAPGLYFLNEDELNAKREA